MSAGLTCCATSSSFEPGSQTARGRLYRDTLAAAALGAGVGAYQDSKNKSEGKSSTGTILANAAIGAGVAMLWNWIFVKDDQAGLAAERDRYKFEADQLRSAVRQGNFDRNVPRDVADLPTVKIGEVVPDGFNFAGLREEGCQVREFSLGIADEPFVPVSPSIIMPRLSYYVLFSKDRKNCVKEDPRRGYLDSEIPGLGKALLDRAEYQARKLKDVKGDSKR
jgi:hypothetical protein